MIFHILASFEKDTLPQEESRDLALLEVGSMEVPL
jgi:hypothetical protein